MRLIVDSNEIISALIKEGMTRTIITSDRIEFYSLEYVMDEIKKHMGYIVQKSDMNKREVELLSDISHPCEIFSIIFHWF